MTKNTTSNLHITTKQLQPVLMAAPTPVPRTDIQMAVWATRTPTYFPSLGEVLCHRCRQVIPSGTPALYNATLERWCHAEPCAPPVPTTAVVKVRKFREWCHVMRTHLTVIYRWGQQLQRSYAEVSPEQVRQGAMAIVTHGQELEAAITALQQHVQR